MLAGATRGKTASKGGGGRVRLLDVDTRELTGFQNELICCFILAVDMVRDGIQEFVNDKDGPASIPWHQHLIASLGLPTLTSHFPPSGTC